VALLPVFLPHCIVLSNGIISIGECLAKFRRSQLYIAWVLQFVAVCDTVLQCIVVCCRVSQMSARLLLGCCSMLQCVILCCSVFLCVAVCRKSQLDCCWGVAVCCSVLYCVAAYCRVLQCVAKVSSIVTLKGQMRSERICP